jgi:nicotinamidase-related amidase
VCVEQTAAELCSRGLQVHVVADACTSRSQEDRLLAFEVRVLRVTLMCANAIFTCMRKN